MHAKVENIYNEWRQEFMNAKSIGRKHGQQLHSRQVQSTGKAIPKIIHQIWLGGKPIPNAFHEWIQSWRKLNPDWQYILWTEETIDQLSMANVRAFDDAKDFGAKSDILRYEIL